MDKKNKINKKYIIVEQHGGKIKKKIDSIKNITKKENIFEGGLPYILPKSRSIDIDNMEDWELAESFYEIAVIGSESKLITDEITNYFSPNTIVVQSKAESDLPLFIDRFFEDETYIYVCQNKTCQRPETNINLALEQVPYIK